MTRIRFYDVEMMFEMQPEEVFFWAIALIAKITGW